MRIDHESILKQTFLRRFLGYDREDVDTYLQIIAADFKEMENELEQLQRESTQKNELIRKLRAEVRAAVLAPNPKPDTTGKTKEITRELVTKTRTQVAQHQEKVKTGVQQLKNDVLRLKEEKKKFLDNLRSNNKARYQSSSRKPAPSTPSHDTADHEE